MPSRFKRIWTPVVGEVLTVAREAGNTEDRFCCCSDMVVGHVPREFSKLSWHFLRHGGTIACEVTGRRKCSPLSASIRVSSSFSSTSGYMYQLQNPYRRQTPSPHENYTYHECVKLYLGSHAVRCYRICSYAVP